VRPCWRRLLAAHAAAYCFQLQPGILGGFNRSPHGLSHKGRNLYTALLDV
jgi:hypothetical protein